MLGRETMGLLALGILWVNALLIAAAAAKQVRALLARRADLAGVVRGRVIGGDGPQGTIAALCVDQVGRATEEGGVLFHDRTIRSEVFGGTIALDGGGEMIVPAERGGGSVEVWLDECSLARAGACPSLRAFEEARAAAAKARGLDCTVTAPISAGEHVFVARRPGSILLALMSPRALLARKAAIGVTFVAGELLAAAGCTALALRPPLFGPTSTAGGVLGLLFFLLVQPASARVRDALLVPSHAPVRGGWLAPPD
jgi:hypothetical protein